MTGGRPQLAALAAAAGILDGYTDALGVERRASDATRARLLAALGFDVSTEAAAAATLEDLVRRRSERVLEPVRVAAAAAAGVVELRLPCAAKRVEWSALLALEGGETRRFFGGRRRPGATLRLRIDRQGRERRALEPGYHRLDVDLAFDGERRRLQQRLVVVPRRAVDPRELGAGRAVGLTANLYSLRGAAAHGFGNVTDLRALLLAAARAGFDFVGSSPLHAIWNRRLERSPYSPISRFHRNPLYLDPQAFPEWSPELAEQVCAPAWRAGAARLRAAPELDYAATHELLEPVFRALFAEFRRANHGRGTSRERAFLEFRSEQGRALDDFATFLALDDRFRAGGAGWWREWPPEYRDPRSNAVGRFRVEAQDEIDYHAFLQFELDRQLGAAAAAARAAGMRIGLYHDLAIGSVADGAEAWMHQDLMVQGVSLGAPPDGYCRKGQVWALPPLDPLRLAASGFDFFSKLIRANLRHAGALRVDHVIGLARQFWVPDGMEGVDGALIRFPAEELLGIVALESRRAGAVVVGEDLGTVPPELPPLLEKWGLLSSRVFLFDADTARYPRRALLTASTHDHVPLAGFLAGADLGILRRLDVVPSDHDEQEARAGRLRLRADLIERLRRRGLLPRAGEIADRELIAALHALLAGSRPALFAISLDDVALETTAVNIPGIGPDRYPCWSRRMARPLHELLADLESCAGPQAPLRRRLAAGRARLPPPRA